MGAGEAKAGEAATGEAGAGEAGASEVGSNLDGGCSTTSVDGGAASGCSPAAAPAASPAAAPAASPAAAPAAAPAASLAAARRALAAAFTAPAFPPEAVALSAGTPAAALPSGVAPFVVAGVSSGVEDFEGDARLSFLRSGVGVASPTSFAACHLKCHASCAKYVGSHSRSVVECPLASSPRASCSFSRTRFAMRGSSEARASTPSGSRMMGGNNPGSTDAVLSCSLLRAAELPPALASVPALVALAAPGSLDLVLTLGASGEVSDSIRQRPRSDGAPKREPEMPPKV